MCYSSPSLEQGEERGICILSMQCLQISHPCIIIYVVQDDAVEKLILLAPCENLMPLFFNLISVLFPHLALAFFFFFVVEHNGLFQANIIDFSRQRFGVAYSSRPK